MSKFVGVWCEVTTGVIGGEGRGERDIKSPD